MSANAAESMMAPPLTATISPAEIGRRANRPRPAMGLVRFSVFWLNQLLMKDCRPRESCAHNAQLQAQGRASRGPARCEPELGVATTSHDPSEPLSEYAMTACLANATYRSRCALRTVGCKRVFGDGDRP